MENTSPREHKETLIINLGTIGFDLPLSLSLSTDFMP